jgi:D-threo-aldose 1-dehydrogenase
LQYRRFGRTGLQVSALTFGGGYVGGILIHADDDVRRTAIRRALDGGINWIDTAVSYGNGKSEEALGWLLHEIDDEPYLSTKFSIDLDQLDDIPGQIERSLHGSLTRLKRESVDLLQLHNRIAPENAGRDLAVAELLKPGGVADGLDRLREQGLIRFAGITALGDAASICAAISSGRFDTAQVYYNLLNPSAGQAVPAGWSGFDFSGILAACKAHDVGVMNIRVFAAGVIATDTRHGREVPVMDGFDLAAEEARARAVFTAIGHDHGTRAQTAIRYALANPDIATVIIGLAELDHLEQALGAVERGPLPAEAMAKLDALYATDFGRL